MLFSSRRFSSESNLSELSGPESPSPLTPASKAHSSTSSLPPLLLNHGSATSSPSSSSAAGLTTDGRPLLRHSTSVLALTSIPAADRSALARATRERRSRAASIGHRDHGRTRSFHSEDQDHEPGEGPEKSLDLEEATMLRSSTGNLRDLAPSSMTRSLSDSNLREMLDGFMRLDSELREVKSDTDKDTKAVLQCFCFSSLSSLSFLSFLSLLFSFCFSSSSSTLPHPPPPLFLALKSLPSISPELLGKLESLCESLLRLGPSELKAGGLRPIVSEIQQVLLDTDSEWAGRVFLTRLLLSIANVTRVVQQFEFVSAHSTSSSSAASSSTVARSLASPVLSRRPSLANLSTPSVATSSPTPTRELEPSSAMLPVSAPLPSDGAPADERNIFVETDLAGVVLYISPLPQELLGLTPSDFVGQDFRKFLASKRDVDAFETTLRLAGANPNAVAEIRCCLLFSDEAVFVSGKGMLCDPSDQGAKIIWVFRVGSLTEEDEGDDRPWDEVLCQICHISVPEDIFAEHSTHCGNVLHSENAVTISNEKLAEILALVSEYPAEPATGYVLARFLDRINRALELTEDAISPQELASGKLKKPMLVWSKSFPKKSLRDYPDLQKLGKLIDRAIREKVIHVLSLKRAQASLEATTELLPQTPTSGGILIAPGQGPAVEFSTSPGEGSHSPKGKYNPLARRKSINTAPITIDDFEIIKPISKGAFGKVFLAKKKHSNFYYAIKVLKKEEMIRKNQVDNIKQERKIMSRTNNPFLVKLYYSFQSVHNLYLVQEYCNGGDCAAVLKLVGYLDEKWATSYVAEVVLALEYLHAQGIVHRDLKPDNLLIDSRGHIKLTDFGLSKVGFLRRNRISKKSRPHSSTAVKPEEPADRTSADPDSRTFAGTPDYLAPEVILGVTELGAEVDWWALGVIFYQFMYGYPPFNAATPEEIFENILNRNIHWDNHDNPPSKEAHSLMDALLKTNPEERLGSKGAREVKEHPLFQDLDWDKLLESEATFVPRTESIEDTGYFDTRGLTLKDLEKELIEVSDNGGGGSSGSQEVSSPPQVPSPSSSPKREEFTDFVFKNADHLREQNEFEAGKLRRRGSTSSNSPLFFPRSSSPHSAPASPSEKPRHNSLPPEGTPSPTQTKGDPLQRRGSSGENKHVLIADGNVVTSKVLRTIMQRLSLESTVANDAATAVMLATTGRQRYDVIFIDRDLPDGGADRAATLIRAVKGHNRSTPMILTAYEKNFGLNKSFDDILIKPFSKQDVEEKLTFWTGQA